MNNRSWKKWAPGMCTWTPSVCGASNTFLEPLRPNWQETKAEASWYTSCSETQQEGQDLEQSLPLRNHSKPYIKRANTGLPNVYWESSGWRTAPSSTVRLTLPPSLPLCNLVHDHGLSTSVSAAALVHTGEGNRLAELRLCSFIHSLLSPCQWPRREPLSSSSDSGRC